MAEAKAETPYNLMCMRHHFDRLQRGFSNRKHERDAKHRTSANTKYVTGEGIKKAQKAYKIMERGRLKIEWLIRRGIRLTSKKIYMRPLVAGIKRALRANFNK